MEALAPFPSPMRVALLWTVPLLYLLAAAAPGLLARSTEAPWRLARWCTLLALAAALLSAGWLVGGGAGVARAPTLFSFGAAGSVELSLRSDAIASTMSLLVAFIGWVIVGYSQTHLGGQRGQPRYLRGLMSTLAAVTLLVTANNLLVPAAAWIAASLALHSLLTFFDQRPQALIAAHKKFLASRVADGCMLGAIALVGWRLGTLEIDEAVAAARSLGGTPRALQAAAVLFAAAACLKCAQLPVHGWLIQVMEAPTPVSALLHAGIVNLGGFLLIRLGTLVADVPVAQALLVVVGSITAVVAATTTMTRVSIKVALAWSTCAQMGFMLMQCGLGLHELALLHIVGHSLYKAHAFLSAGTAVDHDRLRQMTATLAPPGVAAWLASALAGAAVVAAAALAWGIGPAEAPALWAVAAILALALAPLTAEPILRVGGFGSLAGIAGAFAVAFAYFGLHRLFGQWVDSPAATRWGLVAWVITCFAGLFVVQAAVRLRPRGLLARKLYPWLFAGLYLDELFTRLTFRVWPARVPAPDDAPPALLREAPEPWTLR